MTESIITLIGLLEELPALSVADTVTSKEPSLVKETDPLNETELSGCLEEEKPALMLLMRTEVTGEPVPSTIPETLIDLDLKACKSEGVVMVIAGGIFSEKGTC